MNTKWLEKSVVWPQEKKKVKKSTKYNIHIWTQYGH